jgi:F5/8 type C domain/Domain of Unknown Function (DUF1080)
MISSLLLVTFQNSHSHATAYTDTNYNIGRYIQEDANNVGYGATAITCGILSINGILAIGSDGTNLPNYAIDNNLKTRWSNLGLGSWIRLDLGKQMTICSVDIAWYRGNLRQNNFVISVSSDGITFTTVFAGTSSGTTSSFEKYTLPSNTNGRYVRITVNGNTENQWASIREIRVNGYSTSPPPPPPPSGSVLYDNFEGSTYTLADGQTSPNGKWIDNFNGFGSAGVQGDGTGTNNVFFMYPGTSTSPIETHANSVSSTQKFSDFQLDMDVKTVQQLRRNSPPNPWEAATVLFRETDAFHYYAFVVKPNGIEFDKKDCNSCTDPVQGQQFLVTASSPTLKIGAWSHWRITAIGNHITITVDGNNVIDYIDQTMSPQLSSGSVVMYNEDAYAQFDNIYITK